MLIFLMVSLKLSGRLSQTHTTLSVQYPQPYWCYWLPCMDFRLSSDKNPECQTCRMSFPLSITSGIWRSAPIFELLPSSRPTGFFIFLCLDAFVWRTLLNVLNIMRKKLFTVVGIWGSSGPVFWLAKQISKYGQIAQLSCENLQGGTAWALCPHVDDPNRIFLPLYIRNCAYCYLQPLSLALLLCLWTNSETVFSTGLFLLWSTSVASSL